LGLYLPQSPEVSRIGVISASMRRLVASFAPVGLALALTLAACGGSSDGPPPPLGKHFQDSYIAGLPVDQQSEVIKTQSDYNVAQREKAKAEADLREQALQLDVAKNEARAAKLDLDSASARMKGAEQSADKNRINDATREQRGAELAKNAADERVKYYTAYGAWLKKLMRYTEENTYWREAQYELAKARLAQKNNIAPAGFNYQDYVTQEEQRSRRVTAAKGKADDAKSDATTARQKWLAIQGEADKTLGKKSQFPDPMAPHPVEGTDPTQGSGGATIGGEGVKSDQQVQPVDDAAGAGSGSASGGGQ